MFFSCFCYTTNIVGINGMCRYIHFLLSFSLCMTHYASFGACQTPSSQNVVSAAPLSEVLANPAVLIAGASSLCLFNSYLMYKGQEGIEHTLSGSCTLRDKKMLRCAKYGYFLAGVSGMSYVLGADNAWGVATLLCCWDVARHALRCGRWENDNIHSWKAKRDKYNAMSNPSEGQGRGSRNFLSTQQDLNDELKRYEKEHRALKNRLNKSFYTLIPLFMTGFGLNYFDHCDSEPILTGLAVTSFGLAGYACALAQENRSKSNKQEYVYRYKAYDGQRICTFAFLGCASVAGIMARSCLRAQ